MTTAHFLITLFNLQLWPTDKANAPTCTDQWLRRRCDLFERWCLPSVKAQSGSNFKWLVMFDAGSPAWLRQRIEDWQAQCPVFTPCFFTAAEVEGFAAGGENRRVDFIVKAIREHLDGTEEWLLTTNLDNDDALAEDTMARIEMEFASAPGLRLISMVNGLQLFPKWNVALRMNYPHNHFLTLGEPITYQEPHTIERLSHRKARNKFAVTDIAGLPAWIEVVHDTNVSNELRITSRIKYGAILGKLSLRRYGIDLTLSRSSQIKGTLRLAAHFFKVAIWRLKRKL